MKSPVTLLSSLFEDFKRLEHGVVGLDRDLETIKLRFENEGFGFLSIALSSLCSSIDSGLAEGRFTCPSHFSKVRGGSIPKFLQGLICKVFDSKTGALLEHPSVGALKCIREVLLMFKKVQLPPKRVSQLAKEAIAGFLETDASLKDLSIPQSRINHLKDVCKFILPNLDGFVRQDLNFKHGPGSVSETSKANQKWVLLKDLCIQYPDLAEDFGMSDLIFSNHPLTEFDGSNQRRPPMRHAKLVMVPKNSTALRTITVEPVENQYFQQGLNSLLRDNIKKCRILSNSLTLSDQTANQKLAILGSQTDEFATLDLSSASDLLSTKVVEIVFSGRPEFLNSVLQARTQFVEVGKDLLQIEKFAGMGNATMFPIQSVCFAAICMAAITSFAGRKASVGSLRHASRHVRVFGDDIIVSTKYVHHVIDWISSFGLRINHKKSFVKGNFKESCGVDAFKGYEVTPTYVRHNPVVTARNPEQIASLVSASNQLWLKGLYSAATSLRESIDNLVRLPLVSKNSSALGWHSRVDTITAPMRWDKKLQRLVFRARYIKPSYQRDDISNDFAALLKFLAGSNQEETRFAPIGKWDERQLMPLPVDSLRMERSVKRFKTKIASRWEPAHAG